MAEIATPKPFNYLMAITSIDGRFRSSSEKYAKWFSEYAVIQKRVYVEIEYLIHLLAEIKMTISAKDKANLRLIYSEFTIKDALKVRKKDEDINHDTKAIEYFLSDKLTALKLGKFINYLHFGLTSTDIDNTAFAVSLKDFTQTQFLPNLKSQIDTLIKLAKLHKNLVMPARTHGQIAVPTTAGKEITNFISRLNVQYKKLKNLPIGSKVTGAVGNFNALVAGYPKINWVKFSKNFIKSLSLDESYNLTTQVEPYDHKVEYIQIIKRINLINEALCEDIWRYLALGYLSLRDSKGHVGSSTMPQKINPIGFEMGESYALLANGIFDVLEKKLPLNRWQRDLTDKYILRDMGQAMVMTTISIEAVNTALQSIGFNKALIDEEIDSHWELIAEGIQTILRVAQYEKPYEKLKEMTRGKNFTKEIYLEFVNSLEVDKVTKDKLLKLSPQSYIGLAKKLAV